MINEFIYLINILEKNNNKNKKNIISIINKNVYTNSRH